MANEPDELNNRPNTPQKLSWFEFLLDENLLEKHLSGNSPEPGALELLKLFMYQADSASQNVKDQQKESVLSQTDNGDKAGDNVSSGENQKIQALRVLALKVAAYLKWDLDKLQENVPIPMAYALLVELLKLTLPPLTEFGKHSTIDFTSLEDQAFFALSLFHRWCAKIVVKISFPERPSKIGNVQVPGFLDPTITNPAAVDMVLKVVHENIADTLASLEKMRERETTITMPTLQCFKMPSNGEESVQHQWNLGVVVPKEEFHALLFYDLGCFYFFQEQYNKASDMFEKCLSCTKEAKQTEYCEPDKDRLKSYCQACRNLMQVSPPDGSGLQERVEHARRTNYQGLVELLTEDNIKQELDLYYREALENELASQKDRSYLHFKVMACNTVRKAAAGLPASSSFLASLTSSREGHKFLIKVLEDAYLPGSSCQQTNLLIFLRYLVQMTPSELGFLKKLQESKLADKLPTDIMSSSSVAPPDLLASQQVSAAGDADLQFGEIEKLLFWTYEPNTIQELVGKLLSKHKKYYITNLSNKWKIPKEMYQAVEQIGNVQEQVSVHIMIAKARHCMEMKLYRQARRLLQMTDNMVKDRSYKMSKMVRWEMLLTDLLQFEESGTFSDDSSLQDITKRVRACINSLALEQDINPSVEILSHCAAFLLSIKEWDYLTSLTHIKNAHLEVSRLIAAMCREANVIKNARKSAREFWEAVLMMFTMTNQQKRSGSGASNVLQRDSNMGIMTQTNLLLFLTKIRDPLTLSMLLSFFTKVYNIIKDDITIEISSEFLVLWPLTLGSTGNLNTEAITVAVHRMMEHALEVDPHNPVFLRTKADIHYAGGQYSSAMKNYLQAGMTASSWFTEPVPSNVFDEQVYKRMIRCCNYLHCYTQVAVLCQCTEEVDYSTAFKALQEKNSSDAMDSYYEFIWDNTILEYLINLHTKRGEMDKMKNVMQLIGQLELNSSNPSEILHQAADTRKAKFFKTMAKLYL